MNLVIFCLSKFIFKKVEFIPISNSSHDFYKYNNNTTSLSIFHFM